MAVLAAVDWHYWIAVALIVPAVLLVIGTGVMYLKKVTMLKYPPRK